MTNSDYYRAVVFGAVIGMAFLALFYMVDTAFNTKSQPTKPASNFEVVDHYKSCDVVRWSDDMMATYKYFLYCPK
jgi:hypothetical protein